MPSSVGALAFALALLSTPAHAQERSGPVGNVNYPVDPLSIPRPSIAATRVRGPVVIDGLLDDLAWADAVVSRDQWIQTVPDQGMPATQPTTLRLIYDENTLYIGAVLYDDDPHNLTVAGIEQDFDTTNSDIFGVALDTYLDRQNGFLFAVNPEGAIWGRPGVQ